MRRHIIPDVISEQDIVSLPKSATALDAARLMSSRGINSVLVMEDGALAGIFTARDLARRVIAADRSLDTPLAEVMTANPETIAPTASPLDALRRMYDGGFRHLPVTADGELHGIVSRRDLFREEQELTET